jgi:hypothetical protein
MVSFLRCIANAELYAPELWLEDVLVLDKQLIFEQLSFFWCLERGRVLRGLCLCERPDELG